MKIPTKRSAATALALIITALALTACSGAASPNVAPSTAPAIAASTDIELPQAVKDSGLNVAVYLQYPPYRYVDANSQPAGIEIDMLKAVAAKLGVPLNLNSVTFDAIIPGVANGRYDFSAGQFFETPARTAQVDIMDWVKATDKMVVLAGNPDNLDPSDPCGVTFATATGGIEVDEITAMGPVCTAAGKQAPTQVTLPDSPSEQQALISGRVQAILYDPAGANYVSQQNGNKLEVLPGLVPGVKQSPAGWAFPKGGSPIETAVLKAIDELVADGTWGKILGDAGLSDLAIIPPTIDGLPQK